MLSLTIETRTGIFHETDEENIDFGGYMELARLLREVADEIEMGSTKGKIFEMNGNRCGKYFIKED